MNEFFVNVPDEHCDQFVGCNRSDCTETNFNQNFSHKLKHSNKVVGHQINTHYWSRNIPQC